MRCPEASERMSEYLDKRLTASEEMSLMAHIGECGRCQQEWAMLQRVSGVLASPPLIAPPPGFATRFQRRLVRRRVNRRVLRALPVYAVATVALIMMIGSYLSGSIVWDMALAPSLITSTVRVLVHFGSTLSVLGQVTLLLVSALGSAPALAVVLLYSVLAFMVTLFWARLMSWAYAPSRPMTLKRAFSFSI